MAKAKTALLAQPQAYQEACDRLILLLSVSRYEVEILESRLERQERPLYAGISFLKAIDGAIQRRLGVAGESMAHIIPKDVITMDGVDPALLSNADYAQIISQYDSRFAEAEKMTYLRGPKRVIGRAYRRLTGLAFRIAKIVWLASKRRPR